MRKHHPILLRVLRVLRGELFSSSCPLCLCGEIFCLMALCVGCQSSASPLSATHKPQASSPKPLDGLYHVDRVIDGDTIILRDLGRLRFRRHNAPELDEPGGQEAKQHLADLIEGKLVYVRFARRKRDSRLIRDRYGRLLGTIYTHFPPPLPPLR